VPFYEEVSQTLLPLLPHTTDAHQRPVSLLEAFLAAPFPHPPQDRVQLAPRLSTAAVPTADPRLLVQVTRAHEAEAFGRHAMAQARAQRSVPLRPQGVRTTSVLLLGGPRLIIAPPELREDRRGRRGRRRCTRGPHGAGGSPGRAALGIAARVRPATRAEIARPVGPAASYRAAAARLARRGLACDVSCLGRLSTARAATRSRLRAAARAAARRLPGAPHGPGAGQRGRGSLDGGRVRTQRRRRGRQTAPGRHSFSTPWRAPRLLVIDLRAAQGQPDRLRLPRYAGLLGAAAAVWARLLGSLRLLGATAADVVAGIADGAAGIGTRVARLRRRAEMPAATRVEVLDCSHARPERSDPLATIRPLPQAQRHALSQRWRHALRHQGEGGEVVREAVRTLATTQRGTALPRAWRSLEVQAPRRRSGPLEAPTLSIGSGQVERAVRRVSHLRVTAPGSFWTATTGSGLRHLRAAFKAGRWDEVRIGV